MTERKTVLVAEDDKILRGQMALILGREYDVILAKDGAEALEVYSREAEKIALVLTDWGMPVLNGIQLTVRLWRHNPDLPVIIMTGGMDGTDFRGLLEMPNFAVLCKPFDSYRLKELVKCLVEQRYAMTMGEAR
jgi:DNA-binding NtrC family response regulator